MLEGRKLIRGWGSESFDMVADVVFYGSDSLKFEAVFLLVAIAAGGDD
jgi:hypothetical protein